MITILLNSPLISLLTKPVLAQTWKDPSGQQPAQLVDLEVIFKNILNVAAGFAILAVFIMLLVGGFKYLTSGGDLKATESAKNTLTYAIFGLIALIGVWLLLRFVEIFTGVPVTQFKIPQ